MKYGIHTNDWDKVINELYLLLDGKTYLKVKRILDDNATSYF